MLWSQAFICIILEMDYIIKKYEYFTILFKILFVLISVVLAWVYYKLILK